MVSRIEHDVNYGMESAMKVMIVYLAKWYALDAGFYLAADVFFQWLLTGRIQL